jgi:RNA polymerase sigma-70 factor (ECF subfamily)
MAGMLTTSWSLLEDLRGGRPRAWEQFVRLYAPPLTAFTKRFGLCDADASDAVQETLVAVYQTFRSLSAPFDRSKGRFKSWLRGVAQNKVRDVYRRRARLERTLPPENLAHAATCEAAPDMDAAFEIEWQRSLLSRALAQVIRETDPAVYQAFELYALRGQAPAKVAQLLGTTRNAVFISKTRVLKRLRAVLAELTTEEG